MSAATNLRFRPGRSDTGPGPALLAAFAAEMGTLYVPRFEASSPSATPAELAPPGGAFLVGYLNSEPVACGGLKRLEPQVAEIKRMYVAPAARLRGVARILLARLEEAARELGYTVTRLDTGSAQPTPTASTRRQATARSPTTTPTPMPRGGARRRCDHPTRGGWPIASQCGTVSG